MTEVEPEAWRGGCQCGAVRYEWRKPPDHASICHCRMCQKASGQPFMAFAGGQAADLRWTRGRPDIFKSSNAAERGFCSACGTPLTYRLLDGGRISVTVGSLDRPEVALPELQHGVEGRLAWTLVLHELPEKHTEQWMRERGIASIESCQHPDHERR